MAKRSETSRRSILNATLRLLSAEDTSVQKLSIEAIAREAGVGKTTIYRWWPSKAAVVVDAFMENHLLHTPVRRDVPVRQALEAHLRSLVCQYAGPPGRLVSQLIAESQYDPQTRATFLERFFYGRYYAIIELVQRGIDNGELSADLDAELLSEMIYAPVYQHLLFGHRPLRPELATQLVDQAFALAGARPAGSAQRAQRAPAAA
ncbi:MAG TPA: TetR/AcrR family transcriptional regulator [Solirubrobacteraceae bacterium]|jgi:AcrR family transcriptional regulator